MITFKGVTKIYDSGTVALEDANFTIEQGEFVFIIGTSGAGKSTAAKLITREELPTKGWVSVDGINIASIKRRKMPYYRRKIGMVFQDFRLLPNKTVYDNIAFALHIVGASNRAIKRKVPAALAMVGLSDKADVYPGQLSGGEQQRVALARAVVNNPPILLADEPTGNLDPATAEEIMQILDEINENGTTVVIVTHASDIVDKMKKRVVEIDDGVIIRDEEEAGYEGGIGA